MKVRVGGGGGGASPGASSLRVVSDRRLSSAFAFDIATGFSSSALSATPDMSAELRGLCRLLQNGVEDWRLVDAAPAAPNTWRLRGAAVDLYGDVTGNDWSVFTITYPENSP